MIKTLRIWTKPCLSLGLLLTALSPCRADFATPFVEINNKMGDVSSAHGYVVAMGPEMDPQYLWVIVRTDTFEHVVLRAAAKDGVVKESLLGRWVIIKAVITKAGVKTGAGRTRPELEILSVEPVQVKGKPDSSAGRTP